MKLFFKLKNIEDLDFEEQSRLIFKYVMKYCKFSDKEVKFEKFISHIQQKSLKHIKEYAVGCYTVFDKSLSDQINLKLLNPIIYDHFDVYILI